MYSGRRVTLDDIATASGTLIATVSRALNGHQNVAEAVRLGQRVLLLSSRPGRVVAEWDVPAAARQDPPAAAALTAAITARLGQEIRRHAH